jgi:hypothetical protein
MATEFMREARFAVVNCPSERFLMARQSGDERLSACDPFSRKILPLNFTTVMPKCAASSVPCDGKQPAVIKRHQSIQFRSLCAFRGRAFPEDGAAAEVKQQEGLDRWKGGSSIPALSRNEHKNCGNPLFAHLINTDLGTF